MGPRIRSELPHQPDLRSSRCHRSRGRNTLVERENSRQSHRGSESSLSQLSRLVRIARTDFSYFFRTKWLMAVLISLSLSDMLVVGLVYGRLIPTKFGPFLLSVPGSGDRRSGPILRRHRHRPTNLARAPRGRGTILPHASNPDRRSSWSIHHLRRPRRNSILRRPPSHSILRALVPRNKHDTHSRNSVRPRTHPLPIRPRDRDSGSGSLLRQRIPKRRDLLGLRASTPGLNGHNQHRILSGANNSPISSGPCSGDSRIQSSQPSSRSPSRLSLRRKPTRHQRSNESSRHLPSPRDTRRPGILDHTQKH